MSSVLDQTMGALLLGVITAGILYGVSCSQLYYYYTRYGKDPWGLKLLVFATWASDTVHQGLIIHSVYSYLVTNFANPAALAGPNKSIIAEVIFNGFTGLFVQSFFAHRIWKLSGRKYYLVIPVVSLILAEFVASMVYAVRGFSILTYVQLAELKNLSVCMNAFAAVGDVLIALILCTILHNSRTSFSKSNTLINRLMVFAVNTGLLTSVCAVISMITFYSAPNTFIYITFYFLIGRLYCNSLLATLNARKSLQASSSGGATDVSVSLRDMHTNGATTRGTTYGVSTHTRDGIAIRIDTTKESKREAGEIDYDSAHSKHPMV